MRKFSAVTCISAVACLALVSQATNARSGTPSVGAISPAAERSSTASQLAAMQKRLTVLEKAIKSQGSTSAAHGKLLKNLKTDLANVRQYAYWPARGEVDDVLGKVWNSLVIVECRPNSSSDIFWGTGFAEESLGQPGEAKDIADGFRGYVLTAEHVVEDCLNDAGDVYIFDMKSSRWSQARADAWDPDNDVASLMVKVDLPGLEPAATKPEQGDFVMTIGFGSQWSYENQQPRIATGSVVAVEGPKLISDEASTQGFSGGPIVDWNGRWVGLIQYSESGLTTGGSLTPRAMCLKLYNCASDDKWLRW